MPRKAKDVTDTELAIMRVLWETETSTVRALSTRLYPDEPERQVPTVQKLLGRLETKSCVVRDRTVWPHRYRAAIESADLVGRRLEAMADQLCDGSFVPLLSYILHRRPIAREESNLVNQFVSEQRGNATRDNGSSERSPSLT